MKAVKLILAVLFTYAISFSAAAEPLSEMNPAAYAGYYHTQDEEYLFLANGDLYNIDASADQLLDGPYHYTVYTCGDDSEYMIYVNGNYTLFREQTDKGETEAGGKYFAVNEDYLGTEGSMSFEEGQQIKFADYIFDNDYVVFERDPLTTFLGDMGYILSGTMEGPGFDTPEAALAAYIKGLRSMDIDAMISAFAVETYVRNFSLVNYIERSGMYNPNIGYTPVISDFSYQLNVEARRSEITNQIRHHYMVLQGSKAALGNAAFMPVVVNSSYDSAEDLIKDLFVEDDSSLLRTIELHADYYEPVWMIDDYMIESEYDKLLYRHLEYICADDIRSVAAKFYSDGSPVVIIADAVSYNEQWYLYTMGGVTSTILGVPTMQYGLVPLKYDEDGAMTDLIRELDDRQ